MFTYVVDFLDGEDMKKVENLYRQYYAWLRKRAMSHVDDITKSEDIAQSVMLHVVRYFDSIKKVEEKQLMCYLAVIVDNTAKRFLREEAKIAQVQALNTSELENAECRNVEEETEEKCSYEALKTAYESLEDRDRQILFMRYSMGLGDEQIAEAVGIKKDSVRMAAHRSIKKLKNIIDKEDVI
ncbi:MAG: sigma-70 family RNA polymerase sigma factor [Clostridia bacterium]|nr:sigma-70 family RNA polymerase sigma factor [Clostridia bacterium]